MHGEKESDGAQYTHNAVTTLPNLYRMNSDNNGAGNDREKRDENVDPVCIMEMTKKTNPYCLLFVRLLLLPLLLLARIVRLYWGEEKS